MGWCMLAACLLLAAYRRESWGGTRFISGGEPYRDSVYGIIRPPRATPCTLNPLSRLPCLPVWLHCRYPERGTGAGATWVDHAVLASVESAGSWVLSTNITCATSRSSRTPGAGRLSSPRLNADTACASMRWLQTRVSVVKGWLRLPFPIPAFLYNDSLPERGTSN